MTTQERHRRWYHVTPNRLFVGVLAIQVFLLLSERFPWFDFNEHKGWTVLIAVGVLGAAVLLMLVWGLVCLLLQRRFQFGVRSLLLSVFMLSIPLGWFAWEMQRARRQREAVEAIVGGAGLVLCDFQCDESASVVVRVSKPPRSPWLRKMLGDDFFASVVSVHSGPVVQLEHVGVLTRVKRLGFGTPQIDDTDLVHVQGLTKLQMLDLGGTQVTDKGLRHLPSLDELRELHLWGTRVTDVGVEKLQKALPNCKIIR